jgi:hypothetical protein
VPPNYKIKQKIMAKYHDSILAGHLGRMKTLELISRNYYWINMTKEINQYIDSCLTCQANKPSRQQLPGYLQPLLVPGKPWDYVTLDIIIKLPKSHGFDSILVVVDWLTKMSHFILTNKEVTAKDVANLYIQDVFKLHGTLSTWTSDHGLQFASQVMRDIHSSLGIKTALSTAYHPQSNRQTE